MKLIADSGGTSTDWRLLKNDQLVAGIKTVGFNPFFVSLTEMMQILTTEIQPLVDETAVSDVYFYGSGLRSPENSETVRSAIMSLFYNAQINVYTDMLGSARSLFGKEKGIASILGTGSNACIYNGEDIEQNVLSLGYLFGDEGSGCNIGKKLIEAFLRSEMPSELISKFKQKYSLTKRQLITNIYSTKTPNKFISSFTPFLEDNLDNDFSQKIIRDSFKEFFDNQISTLENFRNYEIGFTGSIAYHFREILIDEMKKQDVEVSKIEQMPIKGLMNYHI